MTPKHRVVLFSRRTCGLCDKARATILAEAGRSRFRFEEIFIDGDERLEREYGLRVPVLSVDGREQFEYAVDPARLRRILESS